MRTAARTTPRPRIRNGEHLLLCGIDWTTYEKFLDAVGNRPIRLTYDGENLEFAVPRWDHESLSRCIDRLVVALGIVLGVIIRGGQTVTLKRSDVKRGVEADQCYYIQNEPAVRGIIDLDLNVMPPPDLALEVDITRYSLDRLGIYAALAVPEIWRYDGEKMFIYHLRNGAYESAANSLAFPVLTAGHVQDFIHGSISLSDTALQIAAPKWVRKHILPLWKKRQVHRGRQSKRTPRPPK
jgi:Uma2 family endonuclease